MEYTPNYGKLNSYPPGTNIDFLNPSPLPQCLPGRWWIQVTTTGGAYSQYTKFYDNHGQPHKYNWENQFRQTVPQDIRIAVPSIIDPQYKYPLPNIVIDVIQSNRVHGHDSLIYNIDLLYQKINKENSIITSNISKTSKTFVPTFVIKNHIEQEKNNNGECAITCTLLKECAKLSILSCYHIFETDALLEAINISKKCPTCRIEGNIIYNS
jgi:hypothetical protein